MIQKRAEAIIQGVSKGRRVIEDGLLPDKDPFAVLGVFVWELVPDATHDEIVTAMGALMRQARDEGDAEDKAFWISLFERKGLSH